MPYCSSQFCRAGSARRVSTSQPRDALPLLCSSYIVTTTTATSTIYAMAQEDYKDYLAARILAENKPVTYRLLSRALKTNVNTAKRLVLPLRMTNASSPQTGCSLSFTRRKMHESRSLFTPLIFSPVRLEIANRAMAPKSEKAKIPTCAVLHS